MRKRQHGQVLIMTTFAAFLLFGMMALAVDLGWAHYVKKSAQAAADAAVLASAEQALATTGQIPTYICGVNGLTCQADTACASSTPNPPLTNIDNGCLYAQQNGFINSGRQRVSLQANTTLPVPTAPGVIANYWVTARVAQRLPILFSSFTGGPPLSAARSTAAIIDLAVYGSLLLINRENDCIPEESNTQLTCGVDLLVSANDNQGRYALEADGGIFMASQKNGTSSDGRYAGENSGGGTVSSPFTYIRGQGWYTDGGNSRWIQTPQERSGYSLFTDPMSGKGQPAPPTGLPNVAVSGGNIVGSSDVNNPRVLDPGNYYAVDNNGRATGRGLSISGYVKFSGGTSGFGNYVFFGGVSVVNPGTIVTFSPGQYIYAGVQHQGSSPGTLFSIASNASINDLTPRGSTQSDPGEVFVFTDVNYRGLNGGQVQSLQVPPALSNVASTLQQGVSGFQTGGSTSVGITLHGLNKNNDLLPSGLDTFSGVVVWQDQANSVVKYTSQGYIDTSCGNPDGCANTSLVNNESPQLLLQGSPNVDYNGTVYQPRGAWTTVQGGGSYAVPVQLIAGSLKIQGSSSFAMSQVQSPITRRVVALIE